VRPALLALGISLASIGAATAMEPATFSMVRAEFDAARINDADVLTWEGDAWVGGDRDKLWFKSEGEIEDGDVTGAEIQALWSHAIADFWDVQAGVRLDLEPDSTAHLALGVQGLAPYRFETEATAFLSEHGDVSARLRQSLDLHLSQRLIAEPYAELEAYAQDVPRLDVGAGFANGEIGLQVRYEVTRKFAPYVDLTWERALGETASRRRAAGAEVENAAVRAGLRFWY